MDYDQADSLVQLSSSQSSSTWRELVQAIQYFKRCLHIVDRLYQSLSFYAIPIDFSYNVNRYVHLVINKLVSQPFYSSFIRLPLPITPAIITTNPKFYPFFKGCISAIDGFHTPAFVSAENTARYRNRKGFISQNVLAACSFSADFVYILSGWEGGAADSQVFHDAHHTDFIVPNGFYYLADAGFPLCDSLLVPY